MLFKEQQLRSHAVRLLESFHLSLVLPDIIFSMTEAAF
jgi:hypothetical protein